MEPWRDDVIDPDTPMEEIVRAFNWCIDKGMALYWATSEWPAYLIVEAHAVANRLQLISPITEVQLSKGSLLLAKRVLKFFRCSSSPHNIICSIANA